MRDAGFTAIFCNIGDHAPSEWDLIRARAATAGITCGPWLRTAERDNQFSIARLRYLIAIADSWGSPLIVNSESELKGSEAGLTSLIAAELGHRDAAISVECWPFANVAWWPLEDYPFLPQIFPAEAEVAKQPEACKEEWHKYGIECVVFTFGAYGIQKPEDYNRLTPFGVYTADDCAQNYAAWSSQGTHNPCVTLLEPEDLVEKIGTQHGITAFVNWLQAQPSIPGRGPNYNEGDMGTWPWPEKLERALNMLVKDHDEVVEQQKET